MNTTPTTARADQLGQAVRGACAVAGAVGVFFITKEAPMGDVWAWTTVLLLSIGVR